LRRDHRRLFIELAMTLPNNSLQRAQAGRDNLLKIGLLRR